MIEYILIANEYITIAMWSKYKISSLITKISRKYFINFSVVC